MNISTVSFRGDLVYKDRYIADKQDNTLDIIRAHFEEQLGPHVFYLEQLAKEKQSLIKPWDKVKRIETEKKQKQEFKVDTPKNYSLFDTFNSSSASS